MGTRKSCASGGDDRSGPLSLHSAPLHRPDAQTLTAAHSLMLDCCLISNIDFYQSTLHAHTPIRTAKRSPSAPSVFAQPRCGSVPLVQSRSLTGVSSVDPS